MQFSEEYVSVCLGTTSANQASATGSLRSDSKTLCRGLALNFVRRVNLYEVCTEAQSNASCASDQIGIFFVGNSLAAGVDPQHNQQTSSMSLCDEFASFSHHGGLVLGAQVDGVAKTNDVHTSFAHSQNSLQIIELGAIGIVLRTLNQVGLGVHLDEVVDLRIVGSILCNKTTLTSKNTDGSLRTDLEKMLRLGIGDVDSLAVEVLVQVLNLLVASKKHQATRTTSCLHVVVNVRLTSFRHNVRRDFNLITSDGGHNVPP